MAEPPKEEAGGGAESQAEAANEPPINRAEEETGGTTKGKTPTEGFLDEAPTEGPAEAPTKGGPEAEGERYAAMKAMPPKVVSVGDGAQRTAIISKPEERR